MSTPLRVLHVGCGNISRLWLDPLSGSNDASIVGFVDIDASVAAEVAQRYGDHLPSGCDLQEMLIRTQPDVVFDCTVPGAHHDVTIAALEAGCHVFGEKPMAETMPQAQAMVAAAARHGRTFAVMQNRRYDPRLRTLRALLDAGHIGRVTTVHADFFIAPHFGGFRETMRHVLLRDMAIHTFDAARFLTGEEPEAVTCTSWNPPGSWYAHGASAVATFEMTGGVVVSYRGSWCAEGLPTSWESRWRIIGTHGSVVWDGAEELRCEVVTGPEGFMYHHAPVPTPTLAESDMQTWHATAIDAFLHAIRTGTTPETVCSDNIQSLALVVAACDSADAQRRVEIAPINSPS